MIYPRTDIDCLCDSLKAVKPPVSLGSPPFIILILLLSVNFELSDATLSRFFFMNDILESIAFEETPPTPPNLLLTESTVTIYVELSNIS